MRSSNPLRLSGYCGADAGGWLTWPMEAERREGGTRAVSVPAAALLPAAGAAAAGAAAAGPAAAGAAAAHVPGAAMPVRAGSGPELAPRRALASEAAAVPDGVQPPVAQVTPGGADRGSVTVPRATVAPGTPGTSGPRETTPERAPAGHRVAQPRAREAPAGQTAARQGPVAQRTGGRGPGGQRTAGRGPGETGPA
jgi:hypothetical protein